MPRDDTTAKALLRLSADVQSLQSTVLRLTDEVASLRAQLACSNRPEAPLAPASSTGPVPAPVVQTASTSTGAAATCVPAQQQSGVKRVAVQEQQGGTLPTASGRCFTCFAYGHRAQDCPELPFTFHGNCYTCGFYGHMALDCPTLQGMQYVWVPDERAPLARSGFRQGRLA